MACRIFLFLLTSLIILVISEKDKHNNYVSSCRILNKYESFVLSRFNGPTDRNDFFRGINIVYGQGSFNLVLTRVDVCKGPKKRDCGEFHMKINNSVTIDFDVLVNESLTPNKGKVLAISNGNEFLRLQINKPCENLFVKPVLMKLFNATNRCVIKKGHYTFALDFQEILRAYYGGMHLYGLYAFKSIFYGAQCNFSCSIIEVQISGNSN